MIGLPKSTEFNKRVPKQAFYEHLNINASLKRSFIDQIKTIIWSNKIAPTTMNLAAGQEVAEIEVFSIHLTGPELNEAVLKQIDREIPYHILFLLEYEEKYQAWIGYKEEAGSGKAAFKVDRYFHTEWLQEEELPVHLEGLNMDEVYENFVRQVAGYELQERPQESLKEAVIKAEEREQIEKEIQSLRKQLVHEKQFNKKVQINNMIKKLSEKF